MQAEVRLSSHRDQLEAIPSSSVYVIMGRYLALLVGRHVLHRGVRGERALDSLEVSGRAEELDVPLLEDDAARAAPAVHVVDGRARVDARLRVDGHEPRAVHLFTMQGVRSKV